MLRKIKFLSVLGVLAFLISLTSITASAEECVNTESRLLFQEGGLYETSYVVEPQRWEAVINDESFEKLVVDSCNAFANSINVSKYNISTTDIGDTYQNVLNNHPELFFVNGEFSYYSNQSTGTVTSIIISYKYSKAEAEPMIKELEEVTNKILSGVNNNWSDAEKALYIHEYLTLNTAYTYNYYDVYNLLVKNRGVCQAYALANMYLLNQLGIECKLVSSDGLNHAWNLVEIDSAWYYTDVTWDDPVPDSLGYSGHKNFLRSKSGIVSTNHKYTDWTCEGSNVYDFATSTYYDDFFWSELTGSLVEVYGYWAYMDSNGISVYNFSDNSSRLLKSLDFIWYVTPGGGNSYYIGTFSGFGVFDGRIIYNSPNTLYSINAKDLIFDTNNAVPVEEYVLKDFSNGQIFGFYCDPNGLVSLSLRENLSSTSQTETVQLVEKNSYSLSFPETVYVRDNNKAYNNGDKVQNGTELYIGMYLDDYVNHRFIINGKEIVLLPNGDGCYYYTQYTVSEENINISINEEAWSDEEMSKYVTLNADEGISVWWYNENFSTLVADYELVDGCYIAKDAKICIRISAEQYPNANVIYINGLPVKCELNDDNQWQIWAYDVPDDRSTLKINMEKPEPSTVSYTVTSDKVIVSYGYTDPSDNYTDDYNFSNVPTDIIDSMAKKDTGLCVSFVNNFTGTIDDEAGSIILTEAQLRAIEYVLEHDFGVSA